MLVRFVTGGLQYLFQKFIRLAKSGIALVPHGALQTRVSQQSLS